MTLEIEAGDAGAGAEGSGDVGQSPAVAPGSSGAGQAGPSGTPSGPSPAGTGEGGASGTTPAANLQHDSSTRDAKTGKFLSKPALPGVSGPRQIKPIPSREARRAAAEGMGKPGGAQGQVAPPPGAPAQDAAGQNQPPAKQPFRFAGKDWDSQDKAEQSFSTLRGMHRSLMERQEVISQENQANHYSASQWKARAETLERELSTLRGGGTASPSAPGGPAAPGTVGARAGGNGSPPAPRVGLPESVDDLLQEVDLGLVEEIAASDGPMAAATYMMRESLDKMIAGVRHELNQARQPFMDFQQNLHATQQIREMIENLGTMTQAGPDGRATAVYPELSDPASSEAIFSIWQRLGFTNEAMLNPMSLMTAVLHYRNMRQMYGLGGAAPGAPGQAGNPAPGNGAAAAAAAVAASLTGGNGAGGDALSGGAPPAVRPASGPESEADRLRREMREAPSPDPVLGFIRRRARA